MKEKIMRWIPLLVLVIFLGTIFVPRWINQQACKAYAEPLFSHALPDGAKVVSTDAVKDDNGGITAAILMQTDLSQEELKAFYADLELEPAEEGHTVSLNVKTLSEEDLDVLKQAKLYEDGASYQFVYIYSGLENDA